MESPSPTPIGQTTPAMGSQPDIGRLICTRRAWAFALAAGPFLILLSIAILTAAFTRFVGMPGLPPNKPLAACLFIFAAALFAGGIHILSGLFVRVRFHEHGAVRSTLLRRITIAYDEAIAIQHRLARKISSGVHTGTIVSISFWTDDGRRISWRGQYRERSTSNPADTGFTGHDELDEVRDTLSNLIADRMADTLLAGSPIPWTSGALLTATGLAPCRGRFKGQTIPYRDIARTASAQGSFTIYRANERRRIAVLNPDEPNFLPGLILFKRLCEMSAATSQSAAA